MVDQKQPRVLAKTARKLSQEGEQFLVVVVGDGPLLPWLRSYVRRNRLEGSVRILGSQPNARTRQLIGVADCVFLPSKNEGIAAAFYEAMALGVPVVGADVGGQRELVTPECGVLVERGKEDKEAERYTRVLAELLRDPERRQKMGEAGRKRIQESFMLDAMGRRMESILEQARIIAVEHPRPLPSADDARRAAVEAMRAAAWALPWPSLALSGPLSWRLRVRLLRALTVVGAPVYRLGMRMGFSRADALKERILRGLFPGPSSKP